MYSLFDPSLLIISSIRYRFVTYIDEQIIISGRPSLIATTIMLQLKLVSTLHKIKSDFSSESFTVISLFLSIHFYVVLLIRNGML